MNATVILVIITALAFDFTNGFHDTANAMATSIATGALRPKIAVGISAVLNLAGAFLSIQVAKTISGGIVDDKLITPAIVLGGLVGAILWNLITWYLSLPSSSSHAVIGGLIGATWAAAGGKAVHFPEIMQKVVAPAVASPIIAGFVAAVGTAVVTWIVKAGRRDSTARGFRTGQVVSASAVSLAHGTNDAQKTMGIITLVLISAGLLPANSAPPAWVIVSAGAAIALGTYVGGWRIIRTVGHRLTHVEPHQGFTAETGSATVILSSANLGYALSTTQVVSGSVVGVGVGARVAGGVHWRIVGEMVLAWLVTLPAAAAMGGLATLATERGTAGAVAVALVTAILAMGIARLAQRAPVNAANVNQEPA